MAFTRILGPGIHTASNINSHNINSTGIITAVSFVGDGSGLTGVASTDYIITGTAATFTGGVDINSDLDVDGHTNLDNVSIAGVTTFSGGLTGTTANFSGDVTVGGVLTYEDVKNVDSVGLGTFREGIFIPDSKKIKIGNTASTPDIEIYHSPSNAFIDNHTGGLFIRGNVTSDVGGNVTIQAKVNENSIICHDDGAVDLYFNNSHKFSTNTSGIKVYGSVDANGSIFSTADNTFFQLGASNDLQLTHNGTDSYIRHTTGSGQLQLRSREIKFLKSDATGIFAQFIQDGAVELYYNNSLKLQTSEKGIQVGTGVTVETNGQATFTGIVTATSFKLANGSDVGVGAGGTWSTYTAGIATSKSVGVNTSTLDDNDLVGVGNSFQGLYISNGMIIHDNTLSGNHYIGTAFNGLMAGPVNIEGTLTVDGNYVVV